MTNHRALHGTWTSRWTFIMAATGSAVGLGNIWKFPYITGENGGGAFVLVYLVCIALVGMPIMIAEVMLGRRGRQSPINTMRDLTQESGSARHWAGIGWMGVVAGILILSFYSVIGGWSLHYIFAMAAGQFVDADGPAVESVFAGLLANKTALTSWHSLFMLLTGSVVALGVTRGVGNAVRVLMPILFVLLLVLLGYAIREGDFARGAAFLFDFKFDQLSWNAVLIALGHSFFTLSLGMGAIMAYGAYMPASAVLSKTVIAVAFLDTLVALVAGLAIFPIVFANPGIEPGAGPGLMFVSLPLAFGHMPGGVYFGVAFFVLVAIAAWSSAISLIEPGVAWMVESASIHRGVAVVMLTGLAWVLGLGTVLSFNDWADFTPFFGMTFFDFLDFLTANIMLPLGGLFIAIFAGWCMKPEHVHNELHAESPLFMRSWYGVIRYIAPVLVALVFIMLLWEKLST